MPNLTQYYIDATNLSLATCVFTDPDLTIVAPQGYYSDSSITRYQTVQGAPPFGTLSTALNSFGGEVLDCPSCVAPCLADEASSSQAIRIEANFNNLGTELQGNYRIPLSLGVGQDTLGAVICRVYFRNQYGAGCGLLLDNEDAFGNITTSFNNFSASGSTPDVAPSPPPGWPFLGAPDGGYQRGLYIQSDGTLNYGGSAPLGGAELVDDTKFLYVGGVGVFGGGPTLTGIYYSPFIVPECTVLDFLQVPNNKPNYSEFNPINCPDCPGEFVPAPSIPVIANPQVHPNMPTWSWMNSGGTFEWTAGPTANITVTEDQVQLSTLTQNTNYSNADGGYRGWYTGVIPKSDPNMQLAYMKLQSLACGASGANGLSIVVNVNCPRVLDPIYYEPAQTYCTQPQSSQIEAFTNGDMSFPIFNVPGAEGISPNFPLYEPVTIYEFGVPNMHDLVFEDAYAETPINPTATPMWCKYLDPDGVPKLFEVTHGIITQTDVLYVPEPAACGDIIKTSTNTIGGGIYVAEATLGAATGAVIIYVFTGQNPKGIYTKLIDADGSTVLIKNNSFSVRGSTNEAGDLTQAQYELTSDSALINETGAPNGGSGYTLMGGASIDPTTVYEEGTGNESETRTVGLYDSYCNDSGFGQWGELVWGEDPNVYNQYGNLYPDGDISHFELAIYIGSLNTTDAPISAIPCLSFVPPNLTFTDCTTGFCPEGICGGMWNPLGNINLPDNPPHVYNGFNAPNNDLWENCVIEIVTGDEFYPLYTYPFTTSGCTDNCLYPLWYYDGQSDQYIQTSVYYQIGVAKPQVQLYGSVGDDTTYDSPGWTMAVIPKTSADEQKVRVEIFSVTSNTNFTVKVECPQLLPYNITYMYEATSLDGPEATSVEQMVLNGVPTTSPPIEVFIAHNAFGGDNVNGIATEAPCVPGIAGTGPCATAGGMYPGLSQHKPHLNDMVFSEQDASVILPAGIYYGWYDGGIPYPPGSPFWMVVDEFGIVRCIKDAAAPYNLCNY